MKYLDKRRGTVLSNQVHQTRIQLQCKLTDEKAPLQKKIKKMKKSLNCQPTYMLAASHQYKKYQGNQNKEKIHLAQDCFGRC